MQSYGIGRICMAVGIAHFPGAGLQLLIYRSCYIVPKAITFKSEEWKEPFIPSGRMQSRISLKSCCSHATCEVTLGTASNDMHVLPHTAHNILQRTWTTCMQDYVFNRMVIPSNLDAHSHWRTSHRQIFTDENSEACAIFAAGAEMLQDNAVVNCKRCINQTMKCAMVDGKTRRKQSLHGAPVYDLSMKVRNTTC